MVDGWKPNKFPRIGRGLVLARSATTTATAAATALARGGSTASGERGELLFELRATAFRAVGLGLGGSHKDLEVLIAFRAMVFVNWHNRPDLGGFREKCNHRLVSVGVVIICAFRNAIFSFQ